MPTDVLPVAARRGFSAEIRVLPPLQIVLPILLGLFSLALAFSVPAYRHLGADAVGFLEIVSPDEEDGIQDDGSVIAPGTKARQGVLRSAFSDTTILS